MNRLFIRSDLALMFLSLSAVLICLSAPLSGQKPRPYLLTSGILLPAQVNPGQISTETAKENAYVNAANDLYIRLAKSYTADTTEFRSVMELPTPIPELDLAAKNYIDALALCVREHRAFSALPPEIGRNSDVNSPARAPLEKAYNGAYDAQKNLTSTLDQMQSKAEAEALNKTTEGTFAYFWLHEAILIRRFNNSSVFFTNPADLLVANQALRNFQQTPTYRQLHLPDVCRQSVDHVDDLIVRARNLSGSQIPFNIDPGHVIRLYGEARNAVTTTRNACNTGEPLIKAPSMKYP